MRSKRRSVSVAFVAPRSLNNDENERKTKMVQRLLNDVYVVDTVLAPADFLRELIAAYRRRGEIRRACHA